MLSTSPEASPDRGSDGSAPVSRASGDWSARVAPKTRLVDALPVQLRRTLERVGFGLYVLLAVVLVGRQMIDKIAGGAVAPTGPVVGGAITTPSLSASPSSNAVVSPTAALAPSPSATASPQATSDPMVVTPYQNGGRRYAALSAPVGYTFRSPLGGRVGVVVYQLLGGEIRVGSNVPSEPFFPYITITNAEQRVILRPGALNRDLELLVKDGDTVVAGSALFRIVGSGSTSWRTFYDANVTAQVLASATALPAGTELDPVAAFKR